MTSATRRGPGQLDRRGFVATAASVVAAAALPGCASFVATPVTPEAGAVHLAVRNFPQLEQPGGYLRIRPAGEATTLLVLHLEDSRYAVVSSICTHLQCTVNVEGARLVCPCHGSTYDREGTLLRGPAMRPLRRYPARLSAEGELVIELGAASWAP